ncbi:MAG TPA: MFS transporter, partial [Anaerolineae bacterium]|nr:MFS transporter [Anaerolineae bacterium]
MNERFRRLWLANTISSLGTQVTMLALPLVAIEVLAASAWEMGVLAAAGTAPYLVVGLPAGVWVDRWRRRSVLLGADVGRAILLLVVPLLAVGGWLEMWHLYGVAFGAGSLGLFYDVAEEAFLPSILSEDELVAGNSQLAMIDAVSELTAPVVAGGLVQLLTAPVAIVVDAVSFLWSAGWLWLVGGEEEVVVAERDFWREVKEGLTYLWEEPILRGMMLTEWQWQLFGGMNDALLILYLTEVLLLPPVTIGMIYAAGSLSALVAARYSARWVGRWGLGRGILRAGLCLGLGWCLVPLMPGKSWNALGGILVAMLVVGVGNLLWNVLATSLKQRLIPNRLLGRVNA